MKTKLKYLLPFRRYSTGGKSPERDVSLFLFFFLSAKSLFTYLLLQEWSDPGNFDIISKLGIGRREFLILAGKFQLVDSPWGEQVPHYKHRRRISCGRFPWKTERDVTGVNKRENSRVNFLAWFFASSSAIRRPNAPQYSVSLALFLSPSLSLTLSLSLSLTLINNYIHAYMCLTVGRQSRDNRPLSRDPSVSFYKKFPNCLKRPKTLFDSRPTVAWPQPLSRDRSATFFKIFPNRLKRPKNVVWQSADGRVTSDHCRVTVQQLFSNFFLIASNVQKTLFDSRPTVAWLQPLSRDRSATFFKKCSNCLKRRKIVVWQSTDGRVTSDHCHVTVQRLFSKFSQIAWSVEKTLFDSRPTVAWPQPLSRDRSATFFKKISNCLKRRKIVVWQSVDGRVTSDHCRVTVQRLFSNFFLIASNVQKTLFDSRPTVAWPQPLSRERSATFFKKFPNCLKRRKIVVWPSTDGRVTSDHCRVTVQRLFSKFSQIAWSVEKTLFDSRPTVAWPQPLSRDRSATFFKIFPNHLKRTKNVVWQSADGRVTSDHCSRDRSATFFKKISNCLKRRKIVVWQSADGRVTSDHSSTASHTASQMCISLFFFFFFPKYRSAFAHILIT